jgi:hypothetical protein
MFLYSGIKLLILPTTREDSKCQMLQNSHF